MRLSVCLLQFLDKVIDGPVVRVVLVFPCRSHARCVQRQVPGYVSQLQFINKVVHTPVVAYSPQEECRAREERCSKEPEHGQRGGAELFDQEVGGDAARSIACAT